VVPLLLPVVLDFYRDPRRFPALRDPAGPLPGGISELLNWVGGADDTQSHGIAQQLGSSTNELHEAVRFFVKEALFRAEGDSYRTLGLGPDADIGQIKRHYRQLMSLFHPDRDTSGHNWETDYAPLINDAYNTLKRSHRGQGSGKAQDVWGANARGPRARVASGPTGDAGSWGTQQGAGPGVRQQFGRRPPQKPPRASGFGRGAGGSQQSPLSPISAFLSTLVSALKTLFTGLTSALVMLGKGLGVLVHGLVSRTPAGLHPGVYVLVGSVVTTLVFLAFKEPDPPAMVLHTPPPGVGNPTETAEPSALEQQRVREAQAAQERQQEEQQRLAMLAEKAAAEKAAAEQAALEMAAAQKAAAEAEAQRQLLAAREAEKAAAEAELKRKATELALANQRAQEAEARRLAELKAQQEAEARLLAEQRALAEQKAQDQEAIRVAKAEAEAAEGQRLVEEAQRAKRAEEQRLAAARRAEQAVKTLFADLAAAYEAEDAGLFTTFFTADAVTSDAVGQEAILRLYEGFFAANEADEFSYRSLSWQRLPTAQGAPQDASESASNPQQVAVRLPDYAVTAKVTIATRARDGSGGRTIEVPITFRVTPMTNGYAIASMEY